MTTIACFTELDLCVCVADFVFSQPLLILVKSLVAFLYAIRKKHVNDVIFEAVAPPPLTNLQDMVELTE